MEQERERLINGWIAHADNFWAWQKLHEIVGKSHDEAWPIVFEIAKRSDSNDVLGSLAAGPVEDMLCAYGDDYYALVKKATDEIFNFKRCLLMGVRITGKGSDKIKALISQIADESLRDGWNPNL